MNTVKSILVTAVVTLENHAANRGEKLLGNASSVKRTPDGKVYISGQMQRHVLFSAIERLNETDSDRGNTYVSNGDGISTNITTDLRSDLGGFLDTNLGDYSGRRTAPVSATPAVALQESKVGQDLLVRLKMPREGDELLSKEERKKQKPQAITLNEFSEKDEMVMNFHLDVGAVGAVKTFTYEEEAHVATNYERKIDDPEHARRIRLFLNATRSLVDYANQARNAVTGEPHCVLIVLDPGMSRKAMQYFSSDETRQQRILSELDARGATYFGGDDADASAMSVYEAYSAALEALNSGKLYRPEFA